MSRTRRILFFAPALLIWSACTPQSESEPEVGRADAPLPRRIVDLSPVITEDLPVRIWGHKLLSDFGFRDTTEFEDVVTEDPVYVVDSYLTLFRPCWPTPQGLLRQCHHHIDGPSVASLLAQNVRAVVSKTILNPCHTTTWLSGTTCSSGRCGGLQVCVGLAVAMSRAEQHIVFSTETRGGHRARPTCLRQGVRRTRAQSGLQFR